MEMIEVKTSELIGAALDWATVSVDGGNIEIWCDENGRFRIGLPFIRKNGMRNFNFEPYELSTNEGFLDQIVSDYKILIIEISEGLYNAVVLLELPGAMADGETPQIAACRAIVAAKFGDTVSVPKDLMQ